MNVMRDLPPGPFRPARRCQVAANRPPSSSPPIAGRDSCAAVPTLRSGQTLDDPEHFRENRGVSVASLRSVFGTVPECRSPSSEYPVGSRNSRLYRRDEKGKVVKERDHLIDATRYLEAAKLSIAHRRCQHRFGQQRNRASCPPGCWLRRLRH